MNELFGGLFDNALTTVIPVGEFLLCMPVSLAIGGLLAGVYAFRARTSRSFLVTLFLLPAVVCVVIMMVNGNIGAGVAVAGAFSLVRFRSVPGTAREICMLFLAMGAGLVAGMGYLAYAMLFALIMGAIMLLLRLTEKASAERSLTMVIPEDLNYTGLFDDLFAEYTASHRLKQVRTTAMGSLFKLTYDVKLRDELREKDFIDALRCRNGNLEILICEKEDGINEL